MTTNAAYQEAKARAHQRSGAAEAAFDETFAQTTIGFGKQLKANRPMLEMIFGEKDLTDRELAVAAKSWMEREVFVVRGKEYGYSELVDLSQKKLDEYGIKSIDPKKLLPRQAHLLRGAEITSEETEKEAEKPWFARIMEIIVGFFMMLTGQGSMWDHVYGAGGTRIADATEARLRAESADDPAMAAVYNESTLAQMRAGVMKEALAAGRGEGGAVTQATVDVVASEVARVVPAPLGAGVPIDVVSLQQPVANMVAANITQQLNDLSLYEDMIKKAKERSAGRTMMESWTSGWTDAALARMTPEQARDTALAEFGKLEDPNSHLSRISAIASKAMLEKVKTLSPADLADKDKLAGILSKTVSEALSTPESRKAWGGMRYGLDEEVLKMAPKQIEDYVSKHYDTLHDTLRALMPRGGTPGPAPATVEPSPDPERPAAVALEKTIEQMLRTSPEVANMRELMPEAWYPAVAKGMANAMRTKAKSALQSGDMHAVADQMFAMMKEQFGPAWLTEIRKGKDGAIPSMAALKDKSEKDILAALEGMFAITYKGPLTHMLARNSGTLLEHPELRRTTAAAIAPDAGHVVSMASLGSFDPSSVPLLGAFFSGPAPTRP